MKTNREKYEHYCAQIEAGDRQAIAELIPVTPTCFYTIRNYEAVAVEVTHLSVYRRGIYKHGADDKVSKIEVEQAKQHAENWAEPTLDTISVWYREVQQFGTATGCFDYRKIDADPGMAWQAEDLAPEIERRRELYAPRDGHTACQYCRKQTPTENLVSHKIFYRDQGGSKTKIGQYCSAQCGGYDQCGHEG